MSDHQSGQVAASAAEIYETFFVPALFAEWPRQVLRAAGVASGDRVLDVGCGTGVLAREAAKLVGRDGAVTGVDINDGMLAVARAKAPDLEWQMGDACALPFETDTFDRVASQFGLMFFPDRPKAVAEMCRVARPGGSVAVAVWASLEATPGYAAVAGLLRDLFGAEIASSIEAPYALGDIATLGNVFREAGVERFEVQTLAGKARFESVEAWVYTDIKGWTLAESIGDEDYRRLLSAAPVALSRFVNADGSVEFDAPAHIVTVAT